MPIPAAFTQFDVEASEVRVWLFRKSGGANGAAPTFTGRWIAINPQLDAALKQAIEEERGRIEEVADYSLLAQNNEASALSIGTVETHADLILERTANPVPGRMASSLRDIQNTHFYVVKLTTGDQSLLAVRKTDSSWRSVKRRGRIDVVFRNEALALDQEPAFSLSRYIDFFIVGDVVLISNKQNFESVLNYREAHAADFVQLQAEPEFSALFADLNPLIAFVGTNKIQLRRVSAIRQKGHYRNADFLDRLRANFDQAHLDLQFGPDGRLVVTPENCSHVITAFLDHRLMSLFSENFYDVPDATQVG